MTTYCETLSISAYGNCTKLVDRGELKLMKTAEWIFDEQRSGRTILGDCNSRHRFLIPVDPVRHALRLSCHLRANKVAFKEAIFRLAINDQLIGIPKHNLRNADDIF